jgi:predicted MFS family arabinose efflux permease
MAAWSATGAAAGASGFLLGGVLTDLAGWAAVFWVNVPLAVVLVIAVRATVNAGAGERSLRSLDLAGAALLTGGVMALVSGSSALEAHRQLLGLALLIGGAALLVSLPPVERRADRPLLPAEAVRDPNLRLGVVVALLNTATTSSMMTLATLHLQQTEGVSASAAGAQFLPFSVCVVAGSSLAAPLLRRRGPGVAAVVGLLLVAAGDAVLLALPIGDWILLLGVSLAGLGIGLASVASNTLGTDVPAALQGTASGALNTAAQLGHAVGVAAFLLLATSTRGSGLPLAGTPLAWGAAALTAAVGGLIIARRSRGLARR